MCWPRWLILLFFVSFLFAASCSSTRDCPRHQKEALIEFKHRLERSFKIHATHSQSIIPGTVSWDPISICCTWVGVTCRSGATSSEVIGLDLMVKGLHLYLGPEVLTPLFRLQSLRSLDISDISINGMIPGPGLANLTKLVHLRMKKNNFTGSIPAEIRNLTQLQELALSGNYLSGEIPTWIGKMNKLNKLQLDDNLLSGDAPMELFQLKNLEDLDLGENKLSLKNSIMSPKSMLSNQTNLKRLDLSNNTLEGSLPRRLAELDVESLFLSNNNLSGRLLPRLFLSKELKALLLHGNQFSGELPYSIGVASNLENLDLSMNNFSGLVPSSISNLTQLQWLDLSENKFSGNIPTFSSSLDYIDLSYNRFTGEVPGAILETAAVLNLRGSALTGNLPKNLNGSQMWRLLHLDLRDNNITGKIPASFSGLIGLRFLNLRNNSLSGSVLCHLSNLKHLQILDLSHNNLTGNIPPCFGNLKGMAEKPYNAKRRVDIPGDHNYHLEHDLEVVWQNAELDLSAENVFAYSLLDLSKNQLTGEIPVSLGGLISLKTLNISHNKISGHIPTTFGDLDDIESLDLSHNNLSGQIPDRFSELLQLTRLDLSNNKLVGQIPNGPQMDRFNDSSKYANNSGLCGQQIQVPCDDAYKKATQQKTRAETESSEIRLWWGMVGFVFGFFWTILAAYSIGFFSSAHQHRKPQPFRRRWLLSRL